MTRWWKIIAAALGIAILIPVALFLWALFTPSRPSQIIDFNPSPFLAKADAEFFYSVGDKLMCSNQITPEAPALIRGQIQNFLVSPDSKRIAVVTNGSLQIVSANMALAHEVVPVSSIYRDPKPIGEHFFRDNDFQWSGDSQSLYLIKDEYYRSNGSQLFSSKGELWRYEIKTGNLELVLKPFPAFKYFLGQNAGIYFSVPVSGDLQLRYFDGDRVHDIDKPNAKGISISQLFADQLDTLFFSFSLHDYVRSVLPKKGVQLVAEKGGPQKLVIRNKAFLALTLGEGFKGPYYGSEMLRSVFLPGERYFLFNVHCGNYNGQLLIDTVSGDYMPLPRDTRVYLTQNTSTFHDFRISGSGIEPIPNERMQADEQPRGGNMDGTTLSSSARVVARR